MLRTGASATKFRTSLQMEVVIRAEIIVRTVRTAFFGIVLLIIFAQILRNDRSLLSMLLFVVSLYA